MIQFNPKRVILNSSFAALTFLVSISLAWLFLFSIHFLYGVWHDYGGIAEAIEKYGPQNRYKLGFAETNREERLALFADINRAVHSGGRDLGNISYEVLGQPRQLLLRKPEVIHLQDVANLINILKWIGFASIVCWLVFVSQYFLNRKPLPNLKTQVFGLTIFVCVVTLLIILIGAESVFNQLHIWVFPKEHEWFFYYQDSLMSTLMFAPTLFAYIAIELVLMSVLFFFLLQFLSNFVFFQYIERRDQNTFEQTVVNTKQDEPSAKKKKHNKKRKRKK